MTGGKQKCQSLKAKGGRCGNYAKSGSEYCGTEGHDDGTATAAAMKRALEKAEAELAAELLDLCGSPESVAAAMIRNRRSDVDPAVALKECEQVFTKWLSPSYDLGSLRATLATAAVERLDGDPVWLLIVTGAGFTKTETVAAAAGAGAYVESTIISEASLLSATPEKEREAGATGGLLRKIGSRGTIVLKDVTSILSMPRETRGAVLAALREVYDGRWTRNVGTGGGMTLEWSGRLVVLGGVTTSWDSHHSVIAAMGDRFLLLRPDSNDEEARLTAGRRALENIGSETAMRAELSEAFGAVLAAMNREAVDLTEREVETVLVAANLVTRGRTAVDRDYKGSPVMAHASEAPTRLAKQLAQIIRGGVAIGMDREDALRLSIRCARDSMPPLRLAIVDDLAEFALTDAGGIGVYSPRGDIRKRLKVPVTTLNNELQALQMLGVLAASEGEVPHGEGTRTSWSYRLAAGIDPNVLRLGRPEK